MDEIFCATGFSVVFVEELVAPEDVPPDDVPPVDVDEPPPTVDVFVVVFGLPRVAFGGDACGLPCVLVVVVGEPACGVVAWPPP